MPDVYAAVDSISDLKSLTPSVSGPEGKVCFVRGYNNRKDGGEGYFYWDRGADASQANGGTLIASTVNGYEDGQSKEGIWRRIVDGPVELSWWGPAANGQTDDSQELKDALQDADRRNRELELGGNIYGLAPEIEIPSAVRIRNGVFRVRNSSDYKYVFDCKRDVVLREVVVDQRYISPHGGRGECIRVTGENVWLKGVKAYGERPVHDNETNYLFRVLNADHVTLEECEAYQADGTAFRPKDTKDLHLENCIAINYFDKGFGYDSDKNKSFGSVFVDGFYSETNSKKDSVNGFLVDPGSESRLEKIIIRDIEIKSDAIEGNGVKLVYVEGVEIHNLIADIPNAANAVKINEVGRARLGNVSVKNRFKIEPGTGPIHVDYLYVDHTTNVKHGGDARLTVDHMVSRGCTARMVQMNTDKANKPDRSCTIRFLDFDAENSTSYVWFDSNEDYPGDAFRLEDVKWGNNVSRFWNLAAGSNEAIKVQRGGASDLPVFMTDGDPSSKNPDSTQYIPTGSKFWHFDAGSGEPIYWFWNGHNFLPGPSLP